ncbi:FKBP-type peptidyl-prolyl cis-trans isomerase [Massilia sp. LXY-6]|uniref:FKBP-type peptidyl-prolyl cis-trans isomerase n=1 Tax=Massilia sp. LXY-6 TaxID=3379823 RepID=UPI003EE35018
MKLLSFPLAAAFAAVLSLTACGGGGGDSGSGNASNPAATVKITDTVVGTGAEAAAGSHVLVNYTGWLYSASAAGNKGAQFDTSAGRGPYEFIVGGNVIQGFSQGVKGLKVGGKRTIVIPSVLGYGPSGSQNIPPNTDLVFDVELVKVCGATC